MLEPMTVRVEVWPLIADKVGLWLASGQDAWRSNAVMADSEPHAEVEYILSTNEAINDTALIHSTSWRVDGPAVILTYVVLLRRTADLARDSWPNALPISLDLAEAVGRPPTNAAVDAPAPRYIDVLMHGIRHLRFLQETDATNAAELDENWREHLSKLKPALARMYDEHHSSAS